MKSLEKVKRVAKNPLWAIVMLNNRGFHVLNDTKYIKLLFKLSTGKKLNLDNPRTFNEKIQWLKIHDRKDGYAAMVDKCEAKKYVARVIGKEYIIPTIGTYERFDDIPFDELPNQFVIKCTHDSGGVIICNDKNSFDIKKARKKINKCLRKNFYWSGREWIYKDIKPRIIIEKYMIDSDSEELRDYKFFCFGGEVRFFKIDFNRFTRHQANYYDRDGTIQEFGEAALPPDFNKRLGIPSDLRKMIELSEKLSKGIPFLRVDLYKVNGKIYFGELTFYPASGFGRITPEKWDRKLGDFIELGQVGKGS